MATAIILTHPSGLTRPAYLGFSWTSLFFGPFPAMFRGDWLGVGAYVLAFLAFAMFTAGFGGGIFWLAWPFFYNRWHARRLVERGYALTGAAIPLDQAKARLLG